MIWVESVFQIVGGSAARYIGPPDSRGRPSPHEHRGRLGVYTQEKYIYFWVKYIVCNDLRDFDPADGRQILDKKGVAGKYWGIRS